MKFILTAFWVLLHPAYWVQIYQTNTELDKALLRELKGGTTFTNIGEYTADFGGFRLWIANHPYASFYIYGHNDHGLPSRHTRHLLKKQLNRDAVMQLIEK